MSAGLEHAQDRVIQPLSDVEEVLLTETSLLQASPEVLAIMVQMSENPEGWSDSDIEAITAVAPATGKYYKMQKLTVTKPDNREDIETLSFQILEIGRKNMKAAEQDAA